MGLSRSRSSQRGAVLVESAITMALFMMLVLAIFEAALLMFDWGRAVEATRTTARALVVNDAPIDLAGMCEEGGSGSTSFTCNGEGVDCGVALVRAQRIAPMLSAGNIRVTYQCTSAGYEERPEGLPLYSVQVELIDFSSTLRIPSLVGFPAEIQIPGFETTRITEDMHTPVVD